MNINELFEKLEERFSSDELSGEFIKHNNHIVWKYVYDKNNDDYYRIDIEDDSDEIFFESVSNEEILLNAYYKDIDLIENFFNEINESNNWSFSDPTIKKNSISIKIF